MTNEQWKVIQAKLGDDSAEIWRLRYEYKLAASNYRRTQTRHINEQHRGKCDSSVKQTRRMYFASEAYTRASWRYDTARRALVAYSIINPDKPLPVELESQQVCQNDYSAKGKYSV